MQLDDKRRTTFETQQAQVFNEMKAEERSCVNREYQKTGRKKEGMDRERESGCSNTFLLSLTSLSELSSKRKSKEWNIMYEEGRLGRELLSDRKTCFQFLHLVLSFKEENKNQERKDRAQSLFIKHFLPYFFSPSFQRTLPQNFHQQRIERVSRSRFIQR